MGMIDTGDITWENQSGLADAEVLPSIREVANRIEGWVRETRAQSGAGNLWQRAKYVSSDNPYDTFRTARKAVQDDDVVSSAADVTEGLILQGVACESPDEAAADLMNQVAAEINLDGYLRTAYRELFTESQTVSATWWGWREYTPRVRRPSGKKNSDGSARTYPSRTKYRLWVPTKVITLDSLMVVPVGQGIFGEDRLCWHATKSMSDMWSGMTDAAPADPRYDPLMANLFTGRYTPTPDEEAELGLLGVKADRLLEFNPEKVWRHTRTRSSYQRFADVRLKSTFRHLDLKQQLMESDRVMLVGAANYILLVRKGSDTQPGTPNEISNLKEGFKVLAKLPVIVSDHRLSIDIIAPSVDQTLVASKYDVLDQKILARLFGSQPVNGGARGDQTAGATTRMVARTLENQRHMLRRMVEDHLINEIWNHPNNKDALSGFGPDAKPSLAFLPRNVQLDNDAQLISAIMAARQSRDLSRDSFLEFLGYDEAVEAQKMEREGRLYDGIFKTAVPFTAASGDTQGGNPPQDQGGNPPLDQGGNTSQVDGAKGGRPAGGGSSSRSAQGQVKKRTGSGAPSTGGAGQ